jgi:hypothetical protein
MLYAQLAGADMPLIWDPALNTILHEYKGGSDSSPKLFARIAS